MTSETLAYIKEMLWSIQASPEQISGRMRRFLGISVSHETIYRCIWADKHAGGILYKNLRHRSKKYNRRAGKAGRGLIPNRVDIDQRPAIVEKKKRCGDIELDTISGARHGGALCSMVDRATKFTFLRSLPRTTAHYVTVAICDALGSLKTYGLLHTCTSDNGKEFAGHGSISETLDIDFFFAKPYHAWERGLNEHTNGLVRQYFPKGMNFHTVSEATVFEVQRRLNDRPRTSLGYRTPAEAFAQCCASVQKTRLSQ